MEAPRSLNCPYNSPNLYPWINSGYVETSVPENRGDPAYADASAPPPHEVVTDVVVPQSQPTDSTFTPPMTIFYEVFNSSAPQSPALTIPRQVLGSRGPTTNNVVIREKPPESSAYYASASTRNFHLTPDTPRGQAFPTPLDSLRLDGRVTYPNLRRLNDSQESPKVEKNEKEDTSNDPVIARKLQKDENNKSPKKGRSENRPVGIIRWGFKKTGMVFVINFNLFKTIFFASAAFATWKLVAKPSLRTFQKLDRLNRSSALPVGIVAGISSIFAIIFTVKAIQNMRRTAISTLEFFGMKAN
jgi:hypothetical protein